LHLIIFIYLSDVIMIILN